MGLSGSGKSTIARLIASFWEADSGEVQIGGVDVRRLQMCIRDRYYLHHTGGAL